MTLRRRHAQTVRNGASDHKVDYVAQVKDIISVEEQQNYIISSKDIMILLNFAYWWSCIGKGLPAALEAGLFLVMSSWMGMKRVTFYLGFRQIALFGTDLLNKLYICYN